MHILWRTNAQFHMHKFTQIYEEALQREHFSLLGS